MFDKPPPSAGEIRALANQLLTWADHLAERPDTGQPMSEEARHDMILGLAEAMRGTRLLRARIFPYASLGNPTWDVLLDLFVRELNGYRTSLDHMAIAGELPAATVHRAVEELTVLGLLGRAADRFDERVIWLSLTERGKQGMFELLEETAELVRLHPAAAAATV
jgi:DNA-binding MarR family transcriptional regulator